ncbi:MAG: Asp-tRNA(Asn)/Glu-tRNA(Gln) amidotransferase subunit GatC [Candidatus Brennerbacteria bacterium]|nr:Asp-tRNA(Asn)/Glu-tRNA(Gln) amidotransferase subunit GatC [Candidatus Brennerbacteria bacterium]
MFANKDLKNLSGLARLEVKEGDKEKSFGAAQDKLLVDLQKIFEHFEELKELDTTGVEPMTGGTFNKNVFRNDNSDKGGLLAETSIEAFPEVDGKFLKIPPVFD